MAIYNPGLRPILCSLAPQPPYGYVYPTQPQQPAQAGAYYADQAPAVQQPAAAPAPALGYPNQHIRFDEQGRPTWGGQPWTSGGAPPR